MYVCYTRKITGFFKVLECIFKFLSDCRNEELTFALAGPTDKISSGYLSVRRSKYEQEQEGVSEASDSI